jgi:carbonic anhydrase/acetyltransferase-like protein (isoleucine patch superfamily)
MPIYAVGDKVPRIHPGAFIAPTASIVGDVIIHDGASVWYGAVVRGDTSYAVIGPGANVQDGAIVHGRADQPAIIEREASVAHNAVIHGAVIGERALVANGALVLDGAIVGAGALVGAGAVVTPGMEIPPGALAVGIPAKVRGTIEPGTAQEEWITGNPGRYTRLAAMHAAGLRELARDDVETPPAPAE